MTGDARDGHSARPLGRALLRTPTFAGSLGALLFWWQSLRPTMMPRSWLASWFPFVTWAQGVVDLFDGFAAGPGFGHDFSHAFVAGWAALAAPDGWTAADTIRLEAFLGWDSHHAE